MRRRNALPLRPQSAAAARPQRAYAQPPKRKLPGKNSLLLSLMVWVLVLQVIPLSIFDDPLTAVVSDVNRFTAPNPILRTIKLSLLAIALIGIYMNRRQALQLFKAINPFFLCLVLLAPVSSLWSISPADTVARSVSILIIVLVSFTFTLGPWNPNRIQQVLRPALTVFLAGSLLFGLLYPNLAIETGDAFTLKGSWHGLASQKNGLGQMASLGTLLWVHAFCTKQVGALKLLVFGGICAACLYLSRSSTSLMSTILACALIALIIYAGSLGRYLRYIIGVLMSVAVIYALVVLQVIPGLNVLLEPVMVFTGKDLSFSGRADIWAIVREHIRLSPMLGSGYGAYWIGDVAESPSAIFKLVLYFYPSESHNGFLEITNDLGFLGLIFLLGYLMFYVRDSIRLLRIDKSLAALLLAIFFQQVIENLSESAWLSYISFGFDAMTLATFALTRAMLEQRRGAARSA